MTNHEAVAVSLRGCAKTFAGGVAALGATDLDIGAGETLVLLGPSGCGKTTLLRLIAGLEAPDPGGRVLFGGDDVTTLPIERRNVGMVFQSYALFPNLTVRGNIAYGLEVRRLPKAEVARRVDEMLAMMHIAPLADRRIDQLSGGQRQRVALARAIAVRPRVLLLDEPLTALDALLRERLRGEIDALLRGLGITAVYVTHDQAEAMVLGDRIVVMSAGRIAQVGSPRDIYHRPADPFVAEFVGTMNRAAAPEGGEVLFRPEDAELVPPERADWRGRVEAVHFLGSRSRVTLREALSGATLVIEASPRHVIERGAEIGIAVAAHHRLPAHSHTPSITQSGSRA